MPCGTKDPQSLSPATGEPQTDVPHGFQIGDTVLVDRWCCPDGKEGELPTRHPEKYTGTIKRFGAQLAMVYIAKANGGVGVVHWDDCKVIKMKNPAKRSE
jgi:hypothetical protein